MTNFTITGAIFNEIEELDFTSTEAMEHSYDNYYGILYQLAEKELDANKDYENESEYEDAVNEEISNMISINRISQDSMLYQALIKWHNRKDENSYPLNLKVLENVRSAVLDGGYLYYVTGCGYDTISSDLLGGSADGQAKKEFLNWINNSSTQEISQWEHIDNACGSVWNAIENSIDENLTSKLEYAFHVLVEIKQELEDE